MSEMEKDGSSITRFASRMCLRTPRGLAAAIEQAAAQRHTGPSEWARQALLGALAADGVHLLPDGRVKGRAAPAGPT